MKASRLPSSGKNSLGALVGSQFALRVDLEHRKRIGTESDIGREDHCNFAFCFCVLDERS